MGRLSFPDFFSSPFSSSSSSSGTSGNDKASQGKKGGKNHPKGNSKGHKGHKGQKGKGQAAEAAEATDEAEERDAAETSQGPTSLLLCGEADIAELLEDYAGLVDLTGLTGSTFNGEARSVLCSFFTCAVFYTLFSCPFL